MCWWMHPALTKWLTCESIYLSTKLCSQRQRQWRHLNPSYDDRQARTGCVCECVPCRLLSGWKSSRFRVVTGGERAVYFHRSECAQSQTHWCSRSSVSIGGSSSSSRCRSGNVRQTAPHTNSAPTHDASQIDTPRGSLSAVVITALTA